MPVGAAAVIIARFVFDLMPGPRPIHLRDWGAVFNHLVLTTVVFGAIASVSALAERRSTTGAAGVVAHALAFTALGAAIASIAVVVIWLFALTGLLLCDAPDC